MQFDFGQSLSMRTNLLMQFYFGQSLTQRSPSILSKSGVSLLLLEILNYRLLPLYRFVASPLASFLEVELHGAFEFSYMVSRLRPLFI